MNFHEEIFMKYQNKIWSSPPRGTKKPLSHIWKSNNFSGRCFIISGGPSLRGFDFNLLENQFTIGINKVCQFYAPDIMFNQDPAIMIPFFRKFGDPVKTTLVVADMDNRTWDDCYYVRCAGQYGISNQIDRIHTGSYSCYGAVNLAIVLGFNPIYLLGYDFQEIDGKDHVIDSWGMPDKFFEVFLPKALQEMESLAELIRDYRPDLKIINLSPNSLLTGFEKVDIKDIL